MQIILAAIKEFIFSRSLSVSNRLPTQMQNEYAPLGPVEDFVCDVYAYSKEELYLCPLDKSDKYDTWEVKHIMLDQHKDFVEIRIYIQE